MSDTRVDMAKVTQMLDAIADVRAALSVTARAARAALALNPLAAGKEKQ